MEKTLNLIGEIPNNELFFEGNFFSREIDAEFFKKVKKLSEAAKQAGADIIGVHDPVLNVFSTIPALPDMVGECHDPEETYDDEPEEVEVIVHSPWLMVDGEFFYWAFYPFDTGSNRLETESVNISDLEKYLES